MESMGYTVPPAMKEAPSSVISEVYITENRRFALMSEVVEADDGLLYVQLEEVNAEHVIQVDESGRETIVESVTFEEDEFVLEGLYQDGENLYFARMVSETTEEEAEEAEEAEESDEDEE